MSDADGLAEALKVAFERLADAPLGKEERAVLQRRLIAITNVAKHDLDRATDRLERWFADLHDAAGPEG